jgi:group I intron endonuclease
MEAHEKNKQTMGIYLITSPSNKVYIGKSVNCEKRFKQYSKLQCKDQPRLFNSLKKYGADAHKFEIIHICEEDELNDSERYFIFIYQTFGTDNGLNLCIGGLGGKVSEESERKKSLKLKGRIFSEEHKKKLSERVISSETKKKLREANLGKKYSLEINLKKGRKGCKPHHAGGHLSESHKKSLSLAFSGSNNPNYGKKHSDEIRNKISEKVRASTFRESYTEERRKSISERFKGKPKGLKQRQSVSVAIKKYWREIKEERALMIF